MLSIFNVAEPPHQLLSPLPRRRKHSVPPRTKCQVLCLLSSTLMSTYQLRWVVIQLH